jgi:hypothetical protein
MNNKKTHKQRTPQQNRALHVLFRLLAEELNNAGLDQRRVLKETVDIPWTSEAVKNQLWRPIQQAQLGKESTKELTTKEIDEVFDTINKHLGERLSVHIPFPSIEEVLLRDSK